MVEQRGPERPDDLLGSPRAVAWCRVLLGVQAIGAAIWIGLSRGGVDRMGKPLGTDFVSFWAAGRLALHGLAAAAYDAGAHAAIEQGVAGPTSPYYAFFYPPPFLLVCAAVAAPPYLPALLIWLAATGLFCWLVTRRVATDPRAWLPFLAFPGLWITLGSGQNALLTTALFGTAMIAWDRRPVAAGFACGLLAIKPQLGVVLPWAMLAARRPGILCGAVAAVLGLCAGATLAFGWSVWPAFLARSATARAALEAGAIGPEKMASVFAAVQVLGGGTPLAWAVQGVVAAAAIVSVVRLSARAVDGAGLIAAVVTGTVLSTPFLLDYDLTVLILPLAWAARRLRGGRPDRQARVVLASAYLLPLVSRGLAGWHLPVAPLVVGLLHRQVVRLAVATDRGQGLRA